MSRLFQKVVRANLANEGIFDFFRGQDDHYEQIHNERMEVLKEMHDLTTLTNHEPFHFGPAVGHYCLNGVVFPDARLAAGALEELGRLAELWVSEYPKAVAQLTQHVEREVFRPALTGKEIQPLVDAFNHGKSFYPAGLKRLLTTQRISRFYERQQRKVAASENFAGDWFIANLNDEGGWQRLVMGFDWQKEFEVESPKQAELAPYRPEEIRLVMHSVEKIMDAAQKFPAALTSLQHSVQWIQQQQLTPSKHLDEEIGDYLASVESSCEIHGELEGLLRFITKPAEVAIKLCHLSIKRMGK